MTSDRAAVPGTSTPFHWRSLAFAGSYVVLYVLLDGLSYVQPVLKLGITPWNPQVGLTLAFLLMRGAGWFPATAIAALIAEVAIRGTAPDTPVLWLASLWIAIGYGTLAALLRRWHLDEPIRTSVAATRFVVSAGITTFFVACVGIGLFVASGELPREAASGSLARYWVGDINGILTLTPLLLYAREWRAGIHALRRHPWQIAAQAGALLITLWVVIDVTSTDQLRFFYPLFVPVIWIALRWGVPGALLGALVVQMDLIIGVEAAVPTPPLVDLQFLMLTLSLTAILLGAVVTERAAVLKRVAGREAEQRALLATAPDAVIVVDPQGLVQSVNPAASRLFGECAGRRLEQLLPASRLEMTEGRSTLEGIGADGRPFPAETAWARLDAPASEGFLVIVRDATERLRAESRLRERDTALARAMRLAVAGELATALAHELNQPITALVSYLRAAEILASPADERDKRLKDTLAKAAQEAIRASDVLRWLRDFYRGGAMKHEPVHIQAVCATVAQAFQERMRAVNAHFISRIEDSIPTVDADSTQLEIVLHNLLANAIEAVAQAPKPWRRIELRAEQMGADVVVSVEDSGPGISADIAQKLFEPFVTSKPDGMGLGLAISRSLLRARGGELMCEPRASLGGARFVVRLPIRASQEIAI